MGLKTARAIVCMILIQLSFNFPLWAEETGPTQTIMHPDMKIAVSGRDFEYLSDLALRVMLDDPLYDFVNSKFITENDKKPKLSQTKIMYLLSKIERESWADVETYLNGKANQTAALTPFLPEDQHPRKMMLVTQIPKLIEPDVVKAKKVAREGLQEDDRKIFQDIADKIQSDEALRLVILKNVTVAQPLLVLNSAFKDGHTFDKIEFAANHDRYEDGDSNKVVPAQDLRKIMVGLIDSLQKGDRLYFNFYDFDMPEMADAVIRAYKRGIHVLAGVDKGVSEHKPTAKVQIDRMREAAKEKNPEYGSLVVEVIDSVGLNHQKLIAGIRTKENLKKDKKLKSFAMMGSGNATQSCNGPEGDVKDWPASAGKRPIDSRPNPNHLVIFDGDLPAAIVASEIRKHVIYRLRGKSGFPIGGAYLLEGKPQKDPLDNERAILAFSPNGGAGDINRDVYTQYLRMGKGPVWGGVFSFSSEDLGKELVDLIKREFEIRRKDGRSMNDLFKIIIDAGFAMRDFSVLLRLSGYNMIEFDANDPFKVPGTKKVEKDPEEFEKKDEEAEKKIKYFVENHEDALFKQLKEAFKAGSPLTDEREKEKEWKVWLENWRSNIRTSPDWFKEKTIEVPGGASVQNMVKLHYKLLAIPELHLSNAGSSINFSNAGESNQEQIVIIQSRRITNMVVGAVRYLWDKFSGAFYSIHKVANRRNKRLSQEEKVLGQKVFEFRKKLDGGQLQCLKFFAGAK